MSVLIAAGQNGLATLAGVLTGKNKPLTFCASAKIDSFQTSSNSTVLPIKTSGGTGYLAARIFQNSASIRQVMATSNDGGNASAAYDLTTNLAGQWRTFVAVFGSNTSRNVYTRINGDAGGLLTASNTTSNVTSGYTGLELLSGTWPSSAARYAYLTVYEGALTSAQADEYTLTGAVIGLTPLFRWDLTTNWGAGPIPSTGSNTAAITPPATWAYSPDNPNFATGPNTAPVITATSFVGFEYLISATDADGQSVSYSTSSAPSHGSLSRSSGAHTYTTNGAFAGSDSFTVAGSDGVGSAYSTMTVTAAGAEDTVPDSFTFGSASGVPVSELIYSSNPVTISGMTPGVNVSAVPSGGLQYRVSPNGGETFGHWLSVASNVQNGYVIEVALVSSPSYSTNVSGALTIGGVAGSFSVTTESEDVSPMIGDNYGPSATSLTAVKLTAITLSAVVL